MLCRKFHSCIIAWASFGMKENCACHRTHGWPHLKVHQRAPVGKCSGCVGDGADGALHSIACLLRALQGSEGLLRASAQLEAGCITLCSRH